MELIFQVEVPGPVSACRDCSYNISQLLILIATKAACIRSCHEMPPLLEFGMAARTRGQDGNLWKHAAVIGGADATSKCMSARF